MAKRYYWDEETDKIRTKPTSNWCTPMVKAKDYDAVAADAARYRHIQVHGFPVRNQTGDPDRRWVAFRDGKEFYGATPSFAIDAALSPSEAGRGSSCNCGFLTGDVDFHQPWCGFNP